MRFGEIRLRPEEYRRLWAAIRADFALDRERPAEANRPSGLWPVRRFLPGDGKANAISTCNSGRGQLAKARRSQDEPLAPVRNGLTWRYRRTND